MDADGRWQILRLHVEDQVPLAVLARHYGIGVRTLERWHARFRVAGFAGLGAKPRADVGGHRLPAELITLIEGLGLVSRIAGRGSGRVMGFRSPSAC